jgi:hypothetical protein
MELVSTKNFLIQVMPMLMFLYITSKIHITIFAIADLQRRRTGMIIIYTYTRFYIIRFSVSLLVAITPNVKKIHA